MFALFINGTTRARRLLSIGPWDVAEIQDAYKLLSPLLGVGAASILCVALSRLRAKPTLTGTLAGQIVMKVFNFRITPWLRRLITRAGDYSRGIRDCHFW
jgi:manganese transport protein